MRRRTWRVRGVPLSFDKAALARALNRHSCLSCIANGDLTKDQGDGDNGATVHTLAPDLRRDQVATVHFSRLPVKLQSLEKGGQLSLGLPLQSTGPASGDKRGQLQQTHQTATVTIDDHFDGLTILYSPYTEPPERHDIDILAVSGIGSHPFGSFVNKQDGHMWLADSLPQDLPTARVIVFGYNISVQNSTSFAELDDIAGWFHTAMSRIQSRSRKPIILIGHSLGGLLIKEALIRISESDTDAAVLKFIVGVFLFGVPNDGMKIESLVPMVSDRPNRSLIQSLRDVNSQVLGMQKRNFFKVITKFPLEIYCFYETELSPTAERQSNGQFQMTGPRECLVSRSSATCCLPPDAPRNRAIPIPRTHSDLVKFARHDSDYDNVIYFLHSIYGRSAAIEESQGDITRAYQSHSDVAPNLPRSKKRWSEGSQALRVDSNDIHSMISPPDGQILPSNSNNPTVRLLGGTTGTLRQPPAALTHPSWVTSVAFSSDSKILASGCIDGKVRLWDPPTGVLRHTLEGDLSVCSVAFSSDSRILASGSTDWTVRLWDATTGALQHILREHLSWVHSVAFSPDGQILASGSRDHTVRLWDATTGALQHVLKDHPGSVYSVAFSPDSRRLASGSVDGVVRLWDTRTGTLQQTLKRHSDSVVSVIFSQDGQMLASKSIDKTVQLWDAATSALRHTITSDYDSLYSVNFSPDSRIIAAGTLNGIVQLWDTTTGVLRKVLWGHSDVVYSLAFSPDGQMLASGSKDRTVRLSRDPQSLK
ncbi:uncharacterized protein N7496_004323 [Penicillium cataractarum]|uniref:DUF676 domain-containing protein n=1 Tax=Penicillium cataractarum TaxID=2100454 RepID=A0A9W9VJP1_9EURO|nr:uncharacterized protein N7496_004323 [Penicillium cataractarum]KAJ5381895.1 hypothetical protein N7496_004323 [Penicillium cataractarum]